MKYILSLFTFVLFSTISKAQAYDSIPPYQKDSSMPHFLLLREDSSWMNTAQLPKHTPVVFIFFNPDCEHCQHEAQELVKNIDKLKNIYFVWTTYQPAFTEIDDFAKQYHLADYKNMHFTKDPNYEVPSFYRLQMTPYLAAYDKHGQLVKTWEGGVNPKELAELLK
ncbi:MAG TPA: thioredoxin fold domain-containing protein [Arachidicoccus sp.]